MLITEQEVYNIAFNRDLSLGLIKPSQIKVSQSMWVGNYILGTFYNRILENENDYRELIEDYLKPIISWGVIYNNFEYIATQITDKGIVQMLIEGTASIIGRDARFEAKLEIKRTILELIKITNLYCIDKKENNDPLFENYIEIDMNKINSIRLNSNQSYITKPY